MASANLRNPEPVQLGVKHLELTVIRQAEQVQLGVKHTALLVNQISPRAVLHCILRLKISSVLASG